MAKTKTFKKIYSIATTILLILSLCLLVIVIATRLDGRQATLFGYGFHIVVSDSMTPEIEVGDFVLSKKVDKSEVKMDDYIVFYSEDPALKGMMIIHQVVAIDTVDGELVFTTQGIKEGSHEDKYKVHEILGLYQGKSKALGFIILKLSDITSWILLIILAVLIWVIVRVSKVIIKTVKENKTQKTDDKDKKDK